MTAFLIADWFKESIESMIKLYLKINNKEHQLLAMYNVQLTMTSPTSIERIGNRNYF
ncbi:hypothetical protein CWATWH0005_4150 [Crocosphaera watsonii WH 0005]|uniref:Uncharacterized protein n=1 Tax=Crocosphaera watsonii WH 0005 TaxID=423472 RepID=T2IUC5_CROWT|nr:hypothetical protein CWATWH0005_4150 [Crocosphaera watsonii WH 0005]